MLIHVPLLMTSPAPAPIYFNLHTGRPGYFDSGYTEAGAPPTLLEDGNYFATYDTIIDPGVATGKKHGWAAGWLVLNGSNPRQVLQRGNEPLLVPTMPWERQTPPEWDWMQATTEGGGADDRGHQRAHAPGERLVCGVGVRVGLGRRSVCGASEQVVVAGDAGVPDLKKINTMCNFGLRRRMQIL